MPRSRSTSSQSRSRIGLALAGGGPLGGIYELGAVIALDEVLEGLDFHNLDVYVGVSSGGFVASVLANELTTREMARVLLADDDRHPAPGSIFMKPALSEYYSRASRLPNLLASALLRYLKSPREYGMLQALASLSKAIPTGLFENENLHRYLVSLFGRVGRSNDFRELRKKLFVVATDLDTGAAVKFGGPGFEHVPISRAVQASAALPGLYPPVRIDGHDYVDGALRRTLHASVALEEGMDLVFCVNPLVPFDSRLAFENGDDAAESLVDAGLPVVLSQTFRALIQSRLKIGMSNYEAQYANRDVLLFEPGRDDQRMFFANIFGYADRMALCQHAYRRTREDLVARRDTLEPVLRKHGIGVRWDVLQDPERHFRRTVGSPRRAARIRGRAGVVSARLNHTLDALEEWLEKRDGTQSR